MALRSSWGRRPQLKGISNSSYLRPLGRNSHRLNQVAVGYLGAVPGAAEALVDLLGDHHRPMMAARAAERDREIALAFTDVVRQQIDQKVGDALDELDGLRERSDIARDFGIAAGKLLERWNVIGIGEEPDIENQVAIGRHAMAVAEAGDIHHDLGFFALAAEFFHDRFA